MIRNKLSTVCMAATINLCAPASFGNDLVDFLRAFQGTAPHYRHHNHGHRPRRSEHRASHGRSHRHRSLGYRRSVSIHVGHSAPRPIYNSHHMIPAPLPQAPPPSRIGALPHELGAIVTCSVPMESHVRVRNADEIAPHALPVIVTVRNPHLAAWGSHGCVEQLAYIQVFVPPVPLREMSVSPCRTRIDLDYHDWEIRILSCKEVVETEYDD